MARVETCSKPYDDLIQRLENIIYNWYDHDELIKHLAWPSSGICDNIDIEDNFIEDIHQATMCWSEFKHELAFPIGGKNEYLDGCATDLKLMSNPLRLHFAVHLLRWFKEHNTKRILKDIKFSHKSGTDIAKTIQDKGKYITKFYVFAPRFGKEVFITEALFDSKTALIKRILELDPDVNLDQFIVL